MRNIYLLLMFIFVGVIFTPAISHITKSDEEKVYVKNRIVISPNPVRSITKIASTDASLKIKSIMVYTIVGDEAMTLNYAVPSKTVQLNVYKLNKGKYIVKVLFTDSTEEVSTLVKL